MIAEGIRILNKAAAKQAVFENIINGYGKKRHTSFYCDFSIADEYGEKEIVDTLKRAKKEWKNNVQYMAELVVVLNHKIWEYYQTNENLGRLYDKLWRETDAYCRKHFKGEDLSFYFNYID